MASITIDLPEQQVAALTAKAQAQGLTLENWLRQMAAAIPASDQPTIGALDWSQCPAVESVPGKVSGAWVLKDTRMPVATIFANLEAGANIDDIMEWYHGLDREQVETVIEFVTRSLDKPPTFEP